jgi:hypothetical protein
LSVFRKLLNATQPGYDSIKDGLGSYEKEALAAQFFSLQKLSFVNELGEYAFVNILPVETNCRLHDIAIFR